MGGSGVIYTDILEEGGPFQRIVEDMKYHDLLIIGKDPHFFYAHPKKDTHTLARVVKQTIGPTLVVDEDFTEINNVLIAYDGSAASARTVRRLVHLEPFGRNISLSAISVYHKDDREAKLILQLLKEYLRVHGYDCITRSIDSREPEREIVRYASDYNADLIVAGAHSVSSIKRKAFGSTTASLLDNSPVPMFLDN